MSIQDEIFNAFFALLRSGLWEHSVRLLPYGPIDFDAVYKLADDQSVVGLVAAGLEHVEDRKVTKPQALPFLKKVYSLESRNDEMNSFIAKMISRLQSANIYALLVKGQGIAQCYERPQWRSSGDIDFFLDENNYNKAKLFFSREIEITEPEGIYSKHLGMVIDSWSVELHGTLRCGLSPSIDRALDSIQAETFEKGLVRVWRNGETDVFIPEQNNDVVFVFTHFLKHFYKGGIGLRQICDWCRLLWTYRDSIDKELLERRLRAMGLLYEWKAFAAFVVDYLGMPVEAMPFSPSGEKWERKARRICGFIMKVGNFGKNRDMSYFRKYPYLVRKTISFGRRCGDLFRHAIIFPFDLIRFFPSIVFNGVRSALRGE